MNDEHRAKMPWWAFPAAAVLILVMLAMAVGQPLEGPPPGSTLDATPEGTRAAFLLLQQLGYKVASSPRIVHGRVRWVLFPRKGLGEAGLVETWVRDGGRLLVADDEEDFCRRLGIPVAVAKGKPARPLVLGTRPRPLRVTAADVLITPERRPDATWPSEGEPLAGIFRRGRGEIWLLYRPLFFRNDRIREADNAIVLCRLAEGMSPSDRIEFDEYFHGLRVRPGVMELLLEPPALWVTLQGCALLALLLWYHVPRFGAVRAAPVQRRRSKEEYVDAMAHLLAGKRAYKEGYAAVRDALRRDLENALGLPLGVPPEALASQAIQRAPSLDAGHLARALAREQPRRPGPAGFVGALNDLEQLRREFFHERNPG